MTQYNSRERVQGSVVLGAGQREVLVAKALDLDVDQPSALGTADRRDDDPVDVGERVGHTRIASPIRASVGAARYGSIAA